MKLFKPTGTNAVSNRKAGAHTSHLNPRLTENAKKVQPRGASKADLRDHARDAGRAVKGNAQMVKHGRAMLSIRRKP